MDQIKLLHQYFRSVSAPSSGFLKQQNENCSCLIYKTPPCFILISLNKLKNKALLMAQLTIYPILLKPSIQNAGLPHDQTWLHLSTIFPGHTGVVNSSSWSYSGQYLVTASKDKTVKLWSKEQTTLMLTLDRLEGNMTPVAETKSRKPQVRF